MVFMSSGMKTGRKSVKSIIKTEKKMVFVLGGVKTDRKSVKDITKMESK